MSFSLIGRGGIVIDGQGSQIDVISRNKTHPSNYATFNLLANKDNLSSQVSLSNGGILNVDNLALKGTAVGANANVSLTNSAQLNVGLDNWGDGRGIETYYTKGQSYLNILSGSSVNINGAFLVGGTTAYLGYQLEDVNNPDFKNKTNYITIDGTNSVLSTNGITLSSSVNDSILTLSNSGTLKSSDDVVLTVDNVNTNATLNVGAGEADAAVAPGVVDAAKIVIGSGTSTINFNHTSTDYTFTSAISEATSGAANGTINQIAGLTRLTADSSGFGGQTNVTGGSLIVNGTLGGDLAVASGGTLGGLGTVGNVTNTGIVSPGDGEGNIGTLTVNGNYVGNGGSLLLDTVLGDDSSSTDKLVITGDASGTTSVTVTNRGGLGALTTGNGIEVVSVGGTSAAGAFALKSDYQFEGQNAVVGGAYAYSLYQGSVTRAVGDNNWYLRSLSVPETPTEPTNPEIPSNPSNPVVPIVPVNPVYQPGAALYEAYPQALLEMNKLGTLQQRIGNRTWLSQAENGVSAANTTEGRGFWMKVDGSTGHINSNVSKTNSNYDLYMAKTQLGVDFSAFENTQGQLIGGVYFQYGHSRSDVYSRFGKGNVKTDGYGLGGTLTWYGNNDIYVDGVAQAMWYRTDINSDTLNRRETNENHGTGYSLSIEAGKNFALNQGWNLTPQAQLSYNSVDFDSFHDAYQARVSRKDGDALTGRIGVALDRETAWKSEAGDMRRLKVYGIANLYYEFLDGTEVVVTGVKFRNRPDRFWGGLGAGITHNLKDDKYSLYGEVEARSSFDDFGDSYFLNGTVGFRAKF